MAVYYLLLISLAGLGFFLTGNRKTQKKTAAYLAVCLFVLTVFATLRYAIGFDYFSYRSLFDRNASMTAKEILQAYPYEPLFHLACRAIYLCGLGYQALIGAVSLFVLSAGMWFLYRYAALPWMGVYLYITLQFLAYDMNLMRQAIAVSFFLLAYPYLLGQKPVPFFLLVAVGGLFHNSLWFASVLYFLLPKKHSLKWYGCLVVAALAAYLNFDRMFACAKPLLPDKYAAYEYSYFWNASTFSYVVPAGLYMVLIFLFRKRIASETRRTIYCSSALYHFLISLFITKHFILERFAVYPFIFSLAAIPEIIASYQNDFYQDASCQDKNSSSCKTAGKRAYYLVMLLFVLYGGAYFLFAASKGFHHVYPYTSLFDKSISVPAAAS